MIKKPTKKKQKISCRHDYKNAIKVGNIDYQCPLCGKLLDPNEWFFMNSFEFIDVDIHGEIKIKKSKKGYNLDNISSLNWIESFKF